MVDMTEDVMARYGYGKAALKKLGPVPECFRLFEAGWLGDRPSEFKVMRVVGAEFRVAKAGPNRGELSVMVPGSKRAVYVTTEEIALPFR